MELPQAQLLRDYLRAVRRVSVRRNVRVTVIDVALFAVLWGSLVIAWVGLSLRGDLGQHVGAALGLLLLGALMTMRIHQLRTLLGSRVALARAISRMSGPLRRLATTRERERDVILRHELLGATELWANLESTMTSGEPPTLRSPELAAAYIARVGAQTIELDPSLALPHPARLPRALAGVLAATLAAGLFLHPSLQPLATRGIELLRAGIDGRPAPEPQPVWTALVLVLDYPDYTRRPDRRVPNPSGSIRVPAGTVVSLELDAAGDADAVRVVVTHDASELASTHDADIVELDPVGDVERRWTGSFTVRAAGSAVVALLDDSGPHSAAELTAASRHSAPIRIELEGDMLPEVELLPLPDNQREANETDRVDVRFNSRDDFGVVEAELVYEIQREDGELERHRLPAGKAPGGAARTWQHRYTWDLSTIPIEQRGTVTYWIEIRDNDPGLGLAPLPDGPGKVAASTRAQLLVHDDEAEHAANIRDLQAIRDAAVDLLAARLTTVAFDQLDEEQALTRKLRFARAMHNQAEGLLTLIASAVDALAVDTMIAEREVETLAGIHERLLALHRREGELHEKLPVGAELERPDERAPLLRELGPHNRRELEQLEDEIIRLDDLVDAQIIAHLETLVARLQASQQKLVEKLEQLAAGDESVRPEIEQLEQRIRADMQRVQQARSQLSKELGDEWMNLDAFKAMEARMRSEELLEQLRNGNVDGALQKAREQLDAIRSLRDRMQQTGEQPDAPALSEEDRQRMKMLRELSLLQDEQTGLRSETRRLEQQWRDAVDGQRPDASTRAQTREQAKQLREQLGKIDDSNLSREARTAWEDAREALEQLEAASEDGQAGESGAPQLELFDAAQKAAAALERAQRGSKPGEAEATALRELSKRADRLRDGLRESLPDPDEVLDSEQTQRMSELAQRQRSLRERADRLLDDPAAQILPEPGRMAMDRADRNMGEAGDALEDAALDGAIGGEQQAWDALQQAIDSLRQSSPPPPPAGGGGESSTEAERDRSLRDQVVEAMREGDRDGFDEDTKRYYEELLR
jgi:hypothetical protein